MTIVTPDQFADVLEAIIGIGVVMGLLVLISRKSSLHIPVLGGKKEYFRFEIIDEANVNTIHRIPIKDLKVLGKWTYFEFRNGIYFVKRKAISRFKNMPSSTYRLHDPNPLSINRASEIIISAEEAKEMANTKVVFDLLRFTLSSVETTVLIALIAVAALSIVGLYFSYTLSTEVGTENALLQQVVHYLFPNSAVAAP